MLIYPRQINALFLFLHTVKGSLYIIHVPAVLLLTLHTEHPVRWKISPFTFLCFVFLRCSSCIRQYLYRFTFPVVLGATILFPPRYWGEPMQKMKTSISIHCLACIKIIHEPGKYDSTVLHCSSVTCL